MKQKALEHNNNIEMEFTALLKIISRQNSKYVK